MVTKAAAADRNSTMVFTSPATTTRLSICHNRCKSSGRERGAHFNHFAPNSLGSLKSVLRLYSGKLSRQQGGKSVATEEHRCWRACREPVERKRRHRRYSVLGGIDPGRWSPASVNGSALRGSVRDCCRTPAIRSVQADRNESHSMQRGGRNGRSARSPHEPQGEHAPRRSHRGGEETGNRKAPPHEWRRHAEQPTQDGDILEHLHGPAERSD